MTGSGTESTAVGGMPRVVRAALVVLVLLAACSPPSEPAITIQGEDGPVRVEVELAATSKEQARGLMWRDELAEDRGMLFVFRRQRPRSFWMKNTPLPLDIIYIDGDGKIVSIAEDTTPYSTDAIPSEHPARYVLEVNAGFARRHGIRVGARTELPARALELAEHKPGAGR